MNNRHIIFIGLMGTGKTTVGKRLARALGRPWIDTDQFLEEKWGFSIADYFAKYGEEAFRDEETDALKTVLTTFSPAVITTGGGIILREINQEQMKQHGFVIHLDADPQTIAKRLKNDQTRPLLQGDLEKRVHQIYQERQGKYDFADLRINTSSLTVDDVLNQILANV
jgi:shikimate kinase